MVKTYAWVNKSTNLIENMIMWDEVSPLILPDEIENVEAPEHHGEWSWLGIGWSYTNGQFVEPENPNPSAQPEQPTTTGSQTL
jgi:hypothetical protein